MQLSPVQARILGCLVEKERTTPDNYPLTMNSLLSACNQSTNRFPVVAFTEAVVSNAILNLRSDNLVRIDYSRSNRADKYRQVLDQALEVDDGEVSLLAVLMLRGPQTAAELRTRTERLYPFADQGEVDATLVGLSNRPEPLVTWLAPMAGQKEARWAHLLAGPIAPEDLPVPPGSAADGGRASRTERIEALEAAVEALTDEVKQLRADHDALAARAGAVARLVRSAAMAERTSHDPGTPSWVDLGSPDPAGSAAFYAGLFGWEAEMDPRPEAGGYGIFMLNGKRVAGLGPQINPNMPPYWTVYVTVADADDTLAKVAAAGGTVIMGPMDVFDAGRMGVVQDSVGAFISIWQPDQMIGAELVNEAGTFGWNELATTDLPAATAFYQAVFGWGLEPHASGDHASIFTVDGRVVCGAHAAAPGEFPAWSAWFGSDDVDASAAKAAELGGKVLMPPNDMDFGRGTVIADPQGAAFGIGKMKGAPPESGS